jgi:hypothetical protein
MRFSWETGSNEIDETDSQHEKQVDPRISIEAGIVIFDDFEKFRINM